jgi:2,6-dihydroxypyridine 3-monooxygenase
MVTSGRVAVVGGSLGGLTAALVLRDAGFDVTVYERSAIVLEQRGAGIGFLPDSARYLVERAKVDLDAISISTERIRYLARDGTVTHDIAQPYRFSSWNTIYRSLLVSFGHDRYLLGHEATGLTPATDHVVVHFAEHAAERVNLLVCADGIGSGFRSQLIPEATREYAGYVAWRGMVPEAQLEPADVAALGDAITYHVFANSHILVYPIPGLDGSVERGRRLFNYVWYRNYLAGDDLGDVLTDADGQCRELSLPPGSARVDHVAELRATARARLPRLLAAVVTGVEKPFMQVIYDVAVPRMAFDRTCLIGDAAWVIRPHAAAGTAKAAADAWALVDALEHSASVPEALLTFEREQLELGRQLLERTRRIGTHSQVTCTWDPRDPELVFGLREPGR